MERQNSSPCSFFVGQLIFVASDSPTEPFGSVFEDDGETGYFYALDFRLNENKIVDALHIYNVDSVTDRQRESTLEIVWSMQGVKALLRINGYAHALFDFGAKRGYCRNNFPAPPPDGQWVAKSHEWNESIMSGFAADGGNLS